MSSPISVPNHISTPKRTRRGFLSFAVSTLVVAFHHPSPFWWVVACIGLGALVLLDSFLPDLRPLTWCYAVAVAMAFAAITDATGSHRRGFVEVERQTTPAGQDAFWTSRGITDDDDVSFYPASWSFLWLCGRAIHLRQRRYFISQAVGPPAHQW